MDMFSYQRFANNKPVLLIAVIVGVVGTLSVPVLWPHVYNILESPSEIAHLMMLGMIGLLALAIFRRD